MFMHNGKSDIYLSHMSGSISPSKSLLNLAPSLCTEEIHHNLIQLHVFLNKKLFLSKTRRMQMARLNAMMTKIIIKNSAQMKLSKSCSCYNHVDAPYSV
jgi:hypothetical protein